jgi:ribosomal-protein-alanine N-acetyltransferase
VLSARGQRVHVRPVAPQDVEPFRAAVEASRERISRWNPVDPERIQLDLADQSPTRRTLMIVANDPAGSHGLVGRVNVSNLVRGTFHSASMGYDAYDPYAGRGLFREGLALVVDLAFRDADDGGLGLHRVEANVQPANGPSAGVLRSLGFRHEGETPRMLWLGGPDGNAWRDHERYALTAQEWPAEPYAPHRRSRRVVLVNGPSSTARSALAAALSAELVLPLLSADVVEGAVADGLPPGDAARLGGPGSLLAAGSVKVVWALLAGCPSGAVLDGSWAKEYAELARTGLQSAGVDPASVVEVWCHEAATQPVPGEPAGPLGLGPVVRFDTRPTLVPAAVARLALDVRARG